MEHTGLVTHFRKRVVEDSVGQLLHTLALFKIWKKERLVYSESKNHIQITHTNSWFQVWLRQKYWVTAFYSSLRVMTPPPPLCSTCCICWHCTQKSNKEYMKKWQRSAPQIRLHMRKLASVNIWIGASRRHFDSTPQLDGECPIIELPVFVGIFFPPVLPWLVSLW